MDLQIPARLAKDCLKTILPALEPFPGLLLPLNNLLDPLKRYRREVIVVYAYIVLVGFQHRHLFLRDDPAAGGVRMDVPEKLPGARMATSETEQREVIEDNSLVADSNDHLILDAGEPLGNLLPEDILVVVAGDQVDRALQLIQDGAELLFLRHAEIAQVEDDAVLRNDLVPVPDYRLVHLIHRGEGTIHMLDNTTMEEVGVRSKEHLLAGEDKAAWNR